MRALATFLAVAFGFSGATALVLFLTAPEAPLARVGLLAIYMFGPALGALAARKVAPDTTPMGAKVVPVSGSVRWWLVAWLAPLALAFVTLFVGALMPGVELLFGDMSSALDRVGAALPPEKLAEARAELAKIPPIAMLGAMILQALIAGISVNAIAAFGEELGWRGFLHVHFTRASSSLAKRFWTRAAVIGALWGAWHAPIILQGHNYPEHRVAGVFMMIAFCVLLSPWFEHVRERTRSVLAVSILHGSINASAGFAILFLKGGSDLLVGVTGLAGFLVLAAANLALLGIRRHRA